VAVVEKIYAVFVALCDQQDIRGADSLQRIKRNGGCEVDATEVAVAANKLRLCG